MTKLRRGGIFAVALCGALAAPAVATADIRIDQTASAPEVRSGETVQFTTIVTNTGPETLAPRAAGLLALRTKSEKYVGNPYLSASTAVGACNTDASAQPYEYEGARCQLPGLAPGQSTQIVATVQVNHSMDQLASVSQADIGGFNVFDWETVRAVFPPEVEGSSKIKLKGLPESCVDRNFDLKVSSKGARKLTAKEEGPWDEWGNPMDASRSWGGKSGVAEGSKLSLDVPLGKERPGFYAVNLIAKYDNGPSQKAEVRIQRCGTPSD